jgi:SAM-dependent methyltransferase
VTYAARTKYNEAQALKYQRRKPHKHRAEIRLVDRAFSLVPKHHRVLDMPCGGARVTIHLARQGYQVSGADLSDMMLQIARENVAASNLSCPIEKQDIERASYADRSFDTVICFRLFHHFPNPEIRQRVVSELCRIAAHAVALSYFSPCSVQSFRRKLSGKDRDRFATPLREVESYFHKAGFRLVKDFAQLALIHTLHVAVFERVGTEK